MSDPLRRRPAWRELERHHEELGERHLRDLFADDPQRGERMVSESAGLYLDYSKNRITYETVRLLVALAEASDVRGRIDAMFSGEKINGTEDRAVLHVALRAPTGERILVDGHDVVPDVHEVLDRMSDSRIRCAAAGGRVTRAGGSATWSTSGSGVRTWAP